MIWETKAVSLWTEVIWDIAQKISLFRFLAHCSPFWVSLWKMLWSGGRTTTRQSRLHRNSFSKSSLSLTPHSSLRVQITAAAPTLRRRSKRAGCSSIHRELSRRRWKGAAGPVDEGSCAARRTLSFSLCSESHLLAFNSMNESTNRENFMVWLDNGSTGIYAV